jgi:hypothetical protein
MAMHRRQFLALAPFVALGWACDPKKLAGDFKGMMTVQQKLVATFREPHVGINVANGTHLTITLANSPNATLPPADKEKRALAMATLAYKEYPSRAALVSVDVVMKSGRDFGVVRWSSTNDRFTFTPAELSAPASSPTAAPAGP